MFEFDRMQQNTNGGTPGERWRKFVDFLGKNLGKFSINLTGDLLATTKLLGAGALLESRELGGYQDPAYIDNYRYNEADGRWYGVAPAPDHGINDWFDPASPQKQADVNNQRFWRDQHNRVERTRPEDGGTDYHSPSLFEIGKNLPKIIDRYREIAPDIWRDLKEYFGRPLRSVNDRFRDALQPQPRDPLAIDLDGDGIETIGVPTTGSPVLFDHNADGVRTGTGWVRPDDAWLVRDLNGNGSIDSGRELFGVDTLITVTEPATQGAPARLVTRNATTGFEALRTLDTGSGTAGSAGHNDGRINSSDAAFANLRIWRDLNQDGISQPAELQTLPAAGIAAISLTVNTTPINLGNGNTVTGTATVTRSNGTTTLAETVSMQAGNLDLANNPFFREFTTAIPRTAAALALPEMGGSGLLRDLREAMSLGTPYAAKLVTAVQAFSAATTRTQQRALLGDVLAAWAETVPEANLWLRNAAWSTVRRYSFSGRPDIAAA